MKKTGVTILFLILALLARKKDMVVFKNGEVFRADIATVDSIAFQYYYTITTTINGSGTVDQGTTVETLEGTSQTLTFTADPGYQVSSVVVNGVDQGAINSYTITDVTTDNSVVVTFEVILNRFMKTYGSSSYTQLGRSIAKTDSGYVLFGVENPASNTSGDYIVVALDQQGDSLWSKTYEGLGAKNHFANAILAVEDGFILAGSNQSDYGIHKIDPAGNTLWVKTYGGPIYGDYGTAITPTSNGYIMTGMAYSFGAGH